MKDGMIFEVIPNAKTASEASSNKIIERIVNAICEMKEISILNIPEIVEENHIGLPYYRNVDTREFGAVLREKCNKDIMLNTVVVHYKSKEIFEKWLDECIDKYNIKNFVFVGQKINSFKYSGPSIIEANSIARGKKVNFGNIFIPERENEADRLISKTAAGCNFFTSQVLFELDRVINMLQEYSIKCSEFNLKPAKFFLSFSPVSTVEDIAFIKWLGAEISEKTEQRLKAAHNMGEESIRIAVEVWSKISDFFENNAKISLGLNLEYITLHNLELSKNIVNILSDIKTENYLNKLPLNA